MIGEWPARLAAAVEEAGLALWRRRPFVAATVASIGVTLLFPALVTLALAWTASAASDAASAERVRVYLREGASAADAAEVRAALEGRAGVDGTEIVDPDALHRRLVASDPRLSAVLDDLDVPTVLPTSIEAWGAASPAMLEAAGREVHDMPQVEDVRYDAEAAERLGALAADVRTAAALLGVVAVAAIGFGIGTVIHVGALARREQIAVMRLVGAPRFHAVAPFAIEGAVQGGLGGLVGWLLCSGALAAAAGPLGTLWPAVSDGVPRRFALLLVFAPAAAGAVAGWLAAASVLRRHARLER